MQKQSITFDVLKQLELHVTKPDFLPIKTLKPDDLYILPLVGAEDWIFLGRINSIVLTPNNEYICYNIRISTMPTCLIEGAQLMFRLYLHHNNEKGELVYSLYSYMHIIVAILDDGGVSVTLIVKHNPLEA